MNWRIEFRPEVERDVAEAAIWYESRQPGLGVEFIEEAIRTWDALSENPMLNCRRHPTKNIRWRLSDRFPYRVIYELLEADRTVIIAAVIHAARRDREWRRRI